MVENGICSSGRIFKVARFRLRPLKNCGEPLAAADAHRFESVALVRAPKLVQQRRCNPGTACADRMAERDTRPVDVQFGPIEVLPLLQDS